MAKSTKVDTTAEVTSEVTVTVTEKVEAPATAPISKQTMEEMEAGKKALAKYASAK